MQKIFFSCGMARKMYQTDEYTLYDNDYSSSRTLCTLQLL